ncbi:hypothetical protein BT93_E2251 [Corymbia citriodora subsp. variegata]|nr:hypothetical protein BT93_E2251 [Corymbia citriodora subsp. variegata]
MTQMSQYNGNDLHFLVKVYKGGIQGRCSFKIMCALAKWFYLSCR